VYRFKTNLGVLPLCPNHHKQAGMGLIPPEELAKYIILDTPLTPEQKFEMVSRLSERIAKAIFG